MERQLYLTALRVLNSFMCGEQQDKSQINELRCGAPVEYANAPIDELCCWIIANYRTHGNSHSDS